ncbi:MAG TPA: LUD domain-containing protein [Candidatus Limnocylindrales bacterium]|nr:LUD domain-containing protein [Candidatus Limnocylindrales bacterium]
MAIATAPTTTQQPTFLSPAHEAAVARAESLIQTSDFAKPADDSTVEATVAALKDKGYDVHVADSGEDAKRIVLELLPEGAEVGQGASQTLDQIGITHEIEESGRYTPVRKITRSMDRSTPEGLQAMRKLGVGPDWYVNSAHALTIDGTIVVASNTGSQLAPLAFGAGEVIFVIGTQKIVPDLDAAMRRLEEHSLPLEHARMRGLYDIDSEVKKLLVIYKEFRPSRFRVVLVRERVGA